MLSMIRYGIKKYFVLSLFCVILANILLAYTQKPLVKLHQNEAANQEQIIAQDQPTHPSIGTKKTKASKALLLLHGLGVNASELDFVVKHLSAKFGDDLLIINPKCREGVVSIMRSTKAQARYVYRHVKYLLSQYGKDPKTFPLIVNGYSQGGVLASIFCATYKDELNICGMVSTSAPLMGLPILECRYRDIRAFLTQKGWQLIPCSNFLARRLRDMRLRLNARVLALMRFSWLPIPLVGVKDLLPNSDCIQEVSKFLHSGTHGIPCLLIATYHNDFEKLLNLKLATHHKEAMAAFNNAYAKLITGRNSAYHDTLLPLSSQLLFREDSLLQLPFTESCVYIMPHMPDQPHIQRCIYGDTAHAKGLIFIDLNLPVDDAKTLCYSNHILNTLIGFIKNPFIQLKCSKIL